MIIGIILALAFLAISSSSPLPDVNITQIMSGPLMEVKQHWLGRHLHHHKKVNRIIFQCPALIRQLNASTDNKNITWPPLEHMPDELRQSFLMDGLAIELQDYSYLQQNGNTQPYNWNMETIQYYQDKNNTCGDFYVKPWCAEAMIKHNKFIAGKSGLVIGTMDPWAEAWLLKSGASNITTLEYHRIISHVPNLYSLHPSEVEDRYNAGLRFDFIFTFSSLEHNGLGKWGDPINPSGDLEDFARCHCLLKDDGILFLGIPVGRDEVVWNAHRIYGRFRLSLALQNWKLLDIIGPTDWNNLEARGDWSNQPIFVLQKKLFTPEGWKLENTGHVNAITSASLRRKARK